MRDLSHFDSGDSTKVGRVVVGTTTGNEDEVTLAFDLDEGCTPGTWPRARAVVWCVIGAGSILFWVLLASWLGWV